MSDTPLTDASISQHTEYSGWGIDRIAFKVDHVEVSDCRAIERELREEIAAAVARAEQAERERDAAVVANCPALCIEFCNAYQVHKRNVEVEAQLAEARRDAERLDWIERCCTILGTTENWYDMAVRGTSLRAAIDAAMAKEPTDA